MSITKAFNTIKKGNILRLKEPYIHKPDATETHSGKVLVVRSTSCGLTCSYYGKRYPEFLLLDPITWNVMTESQVIGLTKKLWIDRKEFLNNNAGIKLGMYSWESGYIQVIQVQDDEVTALTIPKENSGKIGWGKYPITFWINEMEDQYLYLQGALRITRMIEDKTDKE